MAVESNDNDLQTFDTISSIALESSYSRRRANIQQSSRNMPTDHKSAKNISLFTYVLLGVAVLVIIAGAVMLGVGITKYNDSKSNNNGGNTANPTTTANSPTTTANSPTTTANNPTTTANSPTTTANSPTITASSPTTTANNPTTTVVTTTGTPPVSSILLKSKIVDLVFLVDQTASTVNTMGQIRQFLSDYVGNFNIGPDATRVAVVGTNSAPTGIPYIWFKDTTNLSDLQANIAKIPAGNGSDNGSPFLHKACEYILQTTFHPTNGRRISVPVVLVIMVFSPSLDPVYYNTATAVWRSTDLFAISLAKYTTANEALIDFTRSADTVAQINSISDLTPNSAVVQTMSNFIFKSAPQQPVPLKAVQSDIVIMIDVTSAMIPAAFNNTLSWLNNFVQYFTISKQFTQISLVLYDTSVRTGSFNLVGDSATLSQKLTGLQWPNSTEPKLNLLGAVQYITNTVLTPDQGWRQQSTYVLVVAINTQIVNTCDDIKSKGTFNLAQKADVYGMALTGDLAVESYLYCIIPPFPRMNFAKAVPYSFLIQSGLTDTVYDNEVSRSYQLWTNRQPFNTPIPMNLLQIDIIFLVDQSMHLSQSAFMRLQDLIANFAVIGALNVSSSATQLSVISYDKDFFDGGSFALTSATNLNDLTARINGLQWNSGSSAVSFNISGAIDYLTTQVLPQRQAGRAAGVVIFSSSPYATAPSDVQIQKLNSMSGVYGVDVTGLGAAPNYLLQVTKFNNLNIRRLSNAGVLNPNGDIETMQRLNSFISNVANSPNFRNKNLGR